VEDAGDNLSRITLGKKKRDLVNGAVHDAGILVEDAGDNLSRITLG
jgi:hypothetical protein